MRYTFTIFVPLAALVALVGCASGDFGPACTTDDDCDAGGRCVDNICLTPGEDTGEPTGRDTGGGDQPDTTSEDDTGGRPDDSGGGSGDEDTGGGGGEDTTSPTDTGGGTDDTGGGGGQDTNPSMDTGPSGCNDQCGLGEECENGTCVSQCQPNCTNEQQCLDLGNGQGPKCYYKCSEPQSASGCLGSDELCRDLDPDENDELLLCVPSQCQTHSDCQAGTCLHFINDHGRCAANGPKKPGEACDLASMSKRCERGAFCIRSGSGTAGTCRTLCDPWASSPGCGGGEYCSWLIDTPQGLSFLTRRQGYCNPKTDPQGNASYQQCQTQHNMCNHATRCFGSTPLCIKWCRPGEGDCQGEVPGTPGTCYNHFFPGIDKVGRCGPRCGNTTYECQNGNVCKDNQCRIPCSSGSVAQDCCDGNTPCNYTCPNGYCE